MGNEVQIKVTSSFDGKGFKEAKVAADALGPSLKDSGEKAGHSLGDGVAKGTTERLRDSRGRFTSGLNEVVTKDGRSIGRKLGDFISDGITQAPSLAQAGAVVGAILAPEIGGLIAAAVVGGSGLIGIAGGLALAAKDPRVKGAASDLGNSVMGDLSDKAGVFVKPMLGSIEQVKAGYQKIAPEIGAAFGVLSKQVQPLTAKLVSAGQMLVKGWSSAAQASGPVLQAFGGLAQTVAFHVQGMFETLAKDAPQAASSVNDLADSLGHMIDLTTMTVDGLAKVKGGLDTFDHGIDQGRYAVEDFVDKIMGGNSALDLTADGYKKGSEAAQLYRQGVIGIAGSLNDYDHYVANGRKSTLDLANAQDVAARAAQGQADALAGLASELRAQSDPVFGLIEAQTKLGKAQSDAAKAAKKYGEDSPQYKKALQDQAKAALDLTGRVGDLGKTFDGHLSPAMRAAFKSAGLTDKAINGLEKQFRDAKKTGDSFSKTYAANVKANGLTGVISNVRTLKHELATMKTNWSVTVRQNFLTFGKPYSAAGIASGHIGGLAHGGIAGAANGQTSSGLTWVGEQGPELAELPPGTRVHSNPDSMRMARGSGDGISGSMDLNIVGVSPQIEHTLTAALLSTLRFAIQSQGGNVQTVLGRG